MRRTASRRWGTDVLVLLLGLSWGSAVLGADGKVVSLTLIDADTDEPIEGHRPLADGAVIDLDALPTAHLNIRADTEPAVVGSVVFGLNNDKRFRVESTAPYALAGDSGGNYEAWTPAAGKLTITATPYSEEGGQGALGAPLEITLNVKGTVKKTAIPLPGGQPIFEDRGGIAVGEIEACLPVDAWYPDVSLPGYEGTCAYTWRDGDATGKEGRGGLLYFVHLEQTASYTLRLRARSSGAAPGAVTVRIDEERLGTVRVAAVDAWEWSAEESAPAYELRAGWHIVQIAGAGARVSLDRFLLARKGVPTPSKLAESRTQLDVRDEIPNADGPLRNPHVSGNREVWGTVTITFDGPFTWETAIPNPFTDYRLDVVFQKGGARYVVPGYFAADDWAAKRGTSMGNKWRVHFVPDSPGTWEYSAVFATGKDVAVTDFQDGRPVVRGTIEIRPLEGSVIDRRGQGFLRHPGGRYYRFSGSGKYFLKGGADSPENFLAYHEFDGTFDTDGLSRKGEAEGGKFLHRYEPHVKDWRNGNPTLPDGRGWGIIGALSYLARKGMNSVYFIPYNLDGGDGKDTWPWIGPLSRTRFDVSKLDQWRIVLDHMDFLGIMAHLITQETENDQGLDGGELGATRRLYYRELIARFGYKRSLTWNLGEENTNTPTQLKEFVRFFRSVDPYGHPIVVHTYPGQYDKVYTPLLGLMGFDGASLQMNKTGDDTHSETIKWLDRSEAAGWTWLVCLDEYGHGANGVKPDATHYRHDEPRKNCLWANLMAGGAGVEWYFGYQFPHNDLHCEDWRSRDHLWDLTRYAIEFFHEHLPFAEMKHADELTDAADDFCFAKPGEVYAVYLPQGGTTTLDLQRCDKEFDIKWFNPREGGDLLRGSLQTVRGPGRAALGSAPREKHEDWVILLKAK